MKGYTMSMILTFHEGACIRAQAGDTTLVFGPVSKGSKNFKPTNFGADVAFISLNHPDMNGLPVRGRTQTGQVDEEYQANYPRAMLI